MTFASDNLPDASKFSPTGRRLIEQSKEIEALWAQKVVATISAAKKLAEPILMNTFPTYIANLAEALSPDYPRGNATEECTIAEAHGSERFRMTEYSLNQLVTEYLLLKDVLISVLDRDDQLSKTEVNTINNSIFLSIRGSVTSYSSVQDDFKRRFIATLSHDIRNPIGTIKMASDLLLHEYPHNEETTELFSMISSNAQKADDLLTEVLDASLATTSSKIKLNITPCCVNDVVDRCMEQFRWRAKAGITFHGERIEGFWSPRDLERSLDNLLANAIKYGAKDKPITIKVAENHERLMLSVHNSGRSIPKSEQELIFLPFERSRSAREGIDEGWGLGLPFVQAVAEAHGGSVLVDSSTERGTTFTIDIPKDGKKFQT